MNSVVSTRLLSALRRLTAAVTLTVVTVTGVTVPTSSPAAAAPDHWQQLPGRGRDIGVGGNAAWVIGYTSTSGGYSIHRWAGNRWIRVSGGAVRIDVDRNGRPWVVNNAGNIYRRVGNGWQRLPGAARDIGIGANGAVWVIGRSRTSGGYGIYRWRGNGWTRVSGGAVRIDVDRYGRPWVVNNAGNIYRRVGNGWRRLPGAARDIGAHNAVWVIGTNRRPGGYGIYRWRGNGWAMIDGAATQITVARNNRPWVVNNAGSIYRRVAN